MENKTKIFGWGPVEYQDDFITDCLIEELDLEDLSTESCAREIRFLSLRAKASAWAFEDEIRLLRRKKGSLIIEQDSIRSIIFGLRTSLRDRKLIQNIVHNRKSKIELFEIVKGQMDFELKIQKHKFLS